MDVAGEIGQFDVARRRMVEEQLRNRGIADERVLRAMSRIPRHEFAPESYRGEAYHDHPLPIGEGQTISQPYIVAIMLQALALSPSDHVLEVGTGSGYVTALLAEITPHVISIERHVALADAARALLARLGYSSVQVIAGDGSLGYAPGAPYNAILVSAAARELPQPLLDQLAEGGRMIIPVGPPDLQQLQLVSIQNGQSQVLSREICRFVPLVSDLAS